MGSLAIGAFIAHVVFWILVVAAAVHGRWRASAVFVVLWIIGRQALQARGGSAFFVSLVAVLDIALVLIVFQRDIRLS